MGNCSTSPLVQPTSNVIESNEDHNHQDTPLTANIINQINTHTDAYLERAKLEFETKYAQSFSETAKIEDFQLQRTIGTGSFARVMLVKHDTHLLALKIMKKQSIVEMNVVKHILCEKRILQAINCPFIVHLIYAFKDNAQLYLALEYVSGGEMFANLRKVVKYSEDQAQFYAAQIVLALEYLHYLNIIFRNIKPEDILFAADGYLKLTDFGFAKVTEDQTFTLCGTPEYMAPEIIVGRGHNKSVDYWALGILIYEMTTGSTPFAADDPIENYKKTLIGKFEIPDHFSFDLTDLVSKLLEVHPTKRYGCLKDGTKDIKNHNWFASIDWIAIHEKRLQAPFIPQPGVEYYKNYKEISSTSSETIMYSTEFDSF
ncbi:unnamed protein product [Adineta steineri]|uniref:cAMP-dependent protein kinase n=1 Tax=Adineta steineri TaxID=433720 RepID=A0A814BJN5_9BILA|nr:unnamed protein product [Adineta steineri]CAF3986191.1 unnamed protein product [Adineta steineri]